MRQCLIYIMASFMLAAMLNLGGCIKGAREQFGEDGPATEIIRPPSAENGSSISGSAENEIGEYAGIYSGKGEFTYIRVIPQKNGPNELVKIRVPVEIAFTVPKNCQAEKAADWSKRTGTSLEEAKIAEDDTLWWVKFKDVSLPVIDGDKIVQYKAATVEGGIVPGKGTGHLGSPKETGGAQLFFKFSTPGAISLLNYTQTIAENGDVREMLLQETPIKDFFLREEAND